MNKQCEICSFYSALYRAGSDGFWYEFFGICNQSGKSVNRNDVCGIFAAAPQVVKVTAEMLDRAISDVKFILDYYIKHRK